MSKESLKKERDQQWGSSINRGWDRWRLSTFLEVIEAKAGRAIIAHTLILDSPTVNDKAEDDLVDSLQDLINYANKALEKIGTSPDFLTKNKAS